MVGIEQTIWAAAFAKALSEDKLAGLPGGAAGAKRQAWIAVMVFREPLGYHAAAPHGIAEIEAMYREMRGVVESERLSIQKEMVRGLIQFTQGRVDRLRHGSRHHDHMFYAVMVEPVTAELNDLIRELRTMLDG
jgi:hypothetical protein